jgi:hypothetical protein
MCAKSDALCLPILLCMAAVAEWLLLAETAPAEKCLLGFTNHGAIGLLHHNWALNLEWAIFGGGDVDWFVGHGLTVSHAGQQGWW